MILAYTLWVILGLLGLGCLACAVWLADMALLGHQLDKDAESDSTPPPSRDCPEWLKNLR